MDTIEVTFQLPKALAEQAEDYGLGDREVTELVNQWVEKQRKRALAAAELMEIVERLNGLPDELKPTLEEIDEAVEQARREIYEQSLRDSKS